MRSHSTFAAIALALLTTPASAAVIAFDYTATVTATDGTMVPLGQEVHGEFGYDDDPSGCENSGNSGGSVLYCWKETENTIGDPDWYFSITAGDHHAAVTSSPVDFFIITMWLGRYNPEEGQGGDAFRFNNYSYAAPPVTFFLALEDRTATALQQDGTYPTFPAPRDLTNLAAWDSRAEIRIVGGIEFGNFTAQLTSLSQVVVPEPGTGLLVMAGLLGLATWRRA